MVVYGFISKFCSKTYLRDFLLVYDCRHDGPESLVFPVPDLLQVVLPEPPGGLLAGRQALDWRVA